MNPTSSFLFILLMWSFVAPTLQNSFETTSLSPEEDQCPNYKSDFKFCNEVRHSCSNDYESSCMCDPEWCECMTKKVEDHANCSQFVNRECLPTKNITDLFHRDYQQSLFLLPNILQLVENCFDEDEFNEIYKAYQQSSTGFFSSELAMMGAAQQSRLHFTDDCIPFYQRLSNGLITLDSRSHNPIHYADWHCNWEQGDWGMVVARRAAMCLARNEMIDFNHCCAIRRNCYFHQMGKDKCDREFKVCNQEVIGSGKKPENDAFGQIIENHIAASGETAYEIAKSYDYTMESENVVNYRFNGYKIPPDRKCTSIVLKRFSSNEKYNSALFDFYGACEELNIHASSCVSMYELCQIEHKDGLERCQRKASNCFSSMNTDLPKCKDARNKVVAAINEDIPSWLGKHWMTLFIIIPVILEEFILPICYFVMEERKIAAGGTTARESKWNRLVQCFVRHSHVVKWIARIIEIFRYCWNCCSKAEHSPINTAPEEDGETER